jgi:hypothetical protein
MSTMVGSELNARPVVRRTSCVGLKEKIMNTWTRPLFTLALLSCVGLLTATANAQKKAPPPGMEETAPAAPGGKKAPPPGPQTNYEPAEEIKEAFIEACEKDNFPKVLVMVGQDARAGRPDDGATRGGETTGVGGNPGVGANMKLFDRTGITDVLSNALAVHLQDGFGEFVDPESLSDAQRTEVLGKATRDEDDAIATMAQQLNADLVIHINFIELPLAERPDNNERWRCTAEIKHLRRRSRRAVTPFDWDGPVDVRNARRYAGALAEEYMKQYTAMTKIGQGARRAVQLRLENLPLSVSMKDIAEALKDIEGVSGSPKIGDLNQNPSNLNDVEIEVRFAPETYELEDALKKNLLARLNLEATTSRQESNRLIMSIGSAGLVTGKSNDDNCWYFVTEKDGEKNKEFKDFYKNSSQASMAVIVNWVLDPDQRNADTTRVNIRGNYWWYEITTSREQISKMGGTPRLGASPQGTQFVELEQLQNGISEIFNDNGVEMYSADAALAAIEDQAAKLKALSENKAPDADMQVLLNQMPFDYILWGKAQVRTMDQVNNFVLSKYTFSLYEVKTGKLIATKSWDGIIDKLSRKETKGIPSRFFRDTKLEDAVPRYIAGSIMCKWMSRAPVVEFKVIGSPNEAMARRFFDAIDERVDDTTVGRFRYDMGVASFTCGFEMSNDDFKKALSQIADEVGKADGYTCDISGMGSSTVTVSFTKK